MERSSSSVLGERKILPSVICTDTLNQFMMEKIHTRLLCEKYFVLEVSYKDHIKSIHEKVDPIIIEFPKKIYSCTTAANLFLF